MIFFFLFHVNKKLKAIKDISFVVYYKKGVSGNMYSKDSYNYGRHGRKKKD